MGKFAPDALKGTLKTKFESLLKAYADTCKAIDTMEMQGVSHDRWNASKDDTDTKL